ncbi:hypothetical protein GCM10007874_36730 [Labrys miyagiensis]|uniref:Uncharacterized protein n=1 Tax=Labrys miyagiensis TaxID=346912 RepID=A0ABQ6CK59_9HYPH|nr:hypothetical protein [Labrys miyagiensis]GLS20656.1 hypothetical protein GCM10007874_36730 [Labrys miyagiensis]
MVDEAQLIRIAGAVRRFLEPAWLEWHRAWGEMPAVPSRWTDTRSSVFLQKVMREDFGLPATWRSGTPRLLPDGPDDCPYGFQTTQGWEAHAWVEVGGWIVDVTLDQHGGAPVVVAPASDPRYSAGEGPSALPEFSAGRSQAIEELWPKWQASEERQDLIGAPAR